MNKENPAFSAWTQVLAQPLTGVWAFTRRPLVDSLINKRQSVLVYLWLIFVRVVLELLSLGSLGISDHQMDGI